MTAGDGLYTRVGRCATFTVAANDSSALSKQQADYVCDGTDDQVQIQAAMDEAANLHYNGRVQLLAGKYNISAPITWSSTHPTYGLTLEGEGSANTILHLANNSNCNVIEYTEATEIYFALLKNFRINGNRGNQTSGNGIQFDHFNDYRLENLFVIYCKETGIYLNSGWTSAVQNCISEYNDGDGLKVSNGTIVTGGFYSYNVNGIVAATVGTTQIYGTECYDNSASGIHAESMSRGLIHGSTLRNNANGLYLMNCYNLSTESNTINDNTNGIFLRASGETKTGIKITGNIIYDNAVGMLRWASTKNQLKDVTFINNILTNNTVLFSDSVTPPLETWRMYDTYSDYLMDVLAISATHVRSNEDLSAATPITFTLDAQPDVPRTLSWAFDTHAQITEYDMEVIGIDARGNTITETWDETAGWSGETDTAFAVVTSIKMTSRTGTGAGDTMDVGITDVLGLSNIIYETSDVFKIKKNNANATVATAQVNTTYSTYDLSVIGLGAGDDFTIWYRNNLNIIS